MPKVRREELASARFRENENPSGPAISLRICIEEGGGRREAEGWREPRAREMEKPRPPIEVLPEPRWPAGPVSNHVERAEPRSRCPVPHRRAPERELSVDLGGPRGRSHALELRDPEAELVGLHLEPDDPLSDSRGDPEDNHAIRRLGSLLGREGEAEVVDRVHEREAGGGRDRAPLGHEEVVYVPEGGDPEERPEDPRECLRYGVPAVH